MREIISTHMAELSPEEWGKFMGGFSIGSIVEIGQIDHDSECLAQIAAASQSGFLAYYYYDMGGDGDWMSYAYSSIYMGKFLDALNQGGCYTFDVTLQEMSEQYL